MNKTTEALKLAEEALNAMLTHMGMDEDEWTKPTFNQAREALAAILEALAEQSMVMILNDPHPPHRLCECTACLEYWTPLPDCDAFAASGKPIDHIADAGKVIAEPVCKRCNGTKIVSDGEIDNIGGADLEVPIECVRDCPDCAKPVKQEPVADESPRFETEDHDLTTLLELTVDIYSGICNHDTAVWWHETLGKVEAKLTPVDAKAIRAEALEQAAKVADRHSTCLNDTPNVIAAAIRGLK